MTIHRADFAEVQPTEAELAQYAKRHNSRPGWTAVPRAVHLPCATRIWYSGIGIGSHMRACRGVLYARAAAHENARHDGAQTVWGGACHASGCHWPEEPIQNH